MSPGHRNLIRDSNKHQKYLQNRADLMFITVQKSVTAPSIDYVTDVAVLLIVRTPHAASTFRCTPKLVRLDPLANLHF